MFDLPDLEENHRIAKVVETIGGNQFSVVVARSEENNDTSDDTIHVPQLAILPTKFHKLVWVKRNDFVIVETGDEEVGDHSDKNNSNNTGSIRYIISHVLYKDQIKHLKSKNMWPNHDKEFGATVEESETIDGDEKEEGGDVASTNQEVLHKEDNGDDVEDDGIVYGANDDDDFLINTNRIASLQIQDSDSESDEDE